MTFNITLITMLFASISVILILLASIQLIKAHTVPGTRLILAAIAGSILTIFIPESETENGELSLLLGIEVASNAIIMLLASYGFYRLAKHTALNCANKSAQSDA